MTIEIYKEMGAEVISNVSASVGFSADQITEEKLKRLLYVLIQPHGQAIHYRTSGEDATTGTGIHLAALGIVEIWGRNAIVNFKCIQDTSTAYLSCKYYGT